MFAMAYSGLQCCDVLDDLESLARYDPPLLGVCGRYDLASDSKPAIQKETSWYHYVPCSSMPLSAEPCSVCRVAFSV